MASTVSLWLRTEFGRELRRSLVVTSTGAPRPEGARFVADLPWKELDHRVAACRRLLRDPSLRVEFRQADPVRRLPRRP